VKIRRCPNNGSSQNAIAWTSRDVALYTV
jgi:hypothetical protein